jgi:hypothetical protein
MTRQAPQKGRLSRTGFTYDTKYLARMKFKPNIVAANLASV